MPGVHGGDFQVPFSAALELSKFSRGIVGVFGVYTLGDIFFFDLRGLWPPGVVRRRALNHPAGSWGCVPIFSTFPVDVVVVGVPRLFRVFLIVVSRAAS